MDAEKETCCRIGEICDPKEDWLGVFMVVDTARDVEILTRQGYQLVRVMQSKMIVGQRTVPVEGHHNGYTPTLQIPEWGIGNQFLLLQKRDAVLEKLNHDLSNLQMKNHAQDELVRKLQNEKDDLAKKLATAEDDVKRSSIAYKSVQESLAQKRQLEVDIGKLRREIGEKEFARIIGTK